VQLKWKVSATDITWYITEARGMHQIKEDCSLSVLQHVEQEFSILNSIEANKLNTKGMQQMCQAKQRELKWNTKVIPQMCQECSHD
jgi:hypothetical protein